MKETRQSEALGVVGREEAVGETAAAPEPALGVGGDFGRAEGMELALGDAARERLARLSQQLDGCRSEQQEHARPLAGEPPSVDDAAQGGEQPRRAVHFVENHQAVGVLGAVLLDVAELGEVARPLQVHVDGVTLRGDLLRQGRLADLSRPDQHHRGVPVQEPTERRLEAPVDHHPCKCNS